MKAVDLIQPAPVDRGENGLWVHPGIPEFDEDPATWARWMESQGLKTTQVCLEDEDLDHPVYISYYEQGDPDVSAWNPTPPVGDGWFTLLIDETEGGPVWIWAGRMP